MYNEQYFKFFYIYNYFITLCSTCVKLLQSCPSLCNPVDRSPTGSLVHGIIWARITEGGAMPFSRDFHNPGG